MEEFETSTGFFFRKLASGACVGWWWSYTKPKGAQQLRVKCKRHVYFEVRVRMIVCLSPDSKMCLALFERLISKKTMIMKCNRFSEYYHISIFLLYHLDFLSLCHFFFLCIWTFSQVPGLVKLAAGLHQSFQGMARQLLTWLAEDQGLPADALLQSEPDRWSLYY